MKKTIGLILALVMLALSFAACQSAPNDTPSSSATTNPSSSQAANPPSSQAVSPPAAQPTPAASNAPITVISREDGSGTRGAFIELFGIEEKDADGNKVDHTIDTAEITNSTSVMMTSVAGDPDAIGYISLGSLNDTVKAAKIDGVEATVENINNGSYAISRPFNIATKETVGELAQDFIAFIMSADGQDIIESSGYIRVKDNGPYSASNLSGKIVVGGSSSVSPVMEKLIEAYLALNTGADIELQTSDSGSGMSNTIDGVFDIGMASRALKDSEHEGGLTDITIAMDGIAVIVNNDSAVNSLTKDQVKGIYTGEVKSWSEIH